MAREVLLLKCLILLSTFKEMTKGPELTTSLLIIPTIFVFNEKVHLQFFLLNISVHKLLLAGTVNDLVNRKKTRSTPQMVTILDPQWVKGILLN